MSPYISIENSTAERKIAALPRQCGSDQHLGVVRCCEGGSPGGIGGKGGAHCGNVSAGLLRGKPGEVPGGDDGVNIGACQPEDRVCGDAVQQVIVGAVLLDGFAGGDCVPAVAMKGSSSIRCLRMTFG